MSTYAEREAAPVGSTLRLLGFPGIWTKTTILGTWSFNEMSLVRYSNHFSEDYVLTSVEKTYTAEDIITAVDSEVTNDDQCNSVLTALGIERPKPKMLEVGDTFTVKDWDRLPNGSVFRFNYRDRYKINSLEYYTDNEIFTLKYLIPSKTYTVTYVPPLDS